jgi:hypothetical protein
LRTRSATGNLSDARLDGGSGMNALKWWLMIVGVLYLLEGGGLTAMALLAPQSFAEVWSSAPAGTLDEVAVRGIKLAGLPGVLTWVLLGALMLVFSRAAVRARVLVIVVAAWELLVWLPLDFIASLNGFEVPRAVTLMAIHLVIGISGVLLLRRATDSTDRVAERARAR